MKDKNNKKVLILKGFFKRHLNDIIYFGHPVYICETDISSFFMRIGMISSTEIIWSSLRIVNEDVFDRWSIDKVEELDLGVIIWQRKR